MNHQRAAEIQVVLEGIRLPATRDELLRYAAREDAPAAHELASLPDREYESLDEVGEELVHVHPLLPAEVPLPHAESGGPPGGDSYLNAPPAAPSAG
jgi:hypothetical protein